MEITNLNLIDVWKQRIKDHEGFRLEPYNLKYGNTTESFQTGGYGHRIIPGEDIPTTKEGWEAVFDADFNKAFEGATRLCQDMNMPDEKFGCFVELAFWIGVTGLSKFKKTLAYAKDNSWDECATELLNSKLARQVPGRSQALANIIKGD